MSADWKARPSEVIHQQKRRHIQLWNSESLELVSLGAMGCGRVHGSADPEVSSTDRVGLLLRLVKVRICFRYCAESSISGALTGHAAEVSELTLDIVTSNCCLHGLLCEPSCPLNGGSH